MEELSWAICEFNDQLYDCLKRKAMGIKCFLFDEAELEKFFDEADFIGEYVRVLEKEGIVIERPKCSKPYGKI